MFNLKAFISILYVHVPVFQNLEVFKCMWIGCQNSLSMQILHNCPDISCGKKIHAKWKVSLFIGKLVCFCV